MAVNLRFLPVCRPFSGDSPATRRRNLSLSAAAGDRKSSPPAKIPARDRVIDFGKYKGRMLGTLPSSYLTWISRNLRAGDTLEWAHLADQVLVDDFYRDRLEWESAHRLLSGDGGADLRRPVKDFSPSAALHDVTRRFGWDNEDKEGWSRVDFQLLGTSRTGRIPRRREDSLAAPPGEEMAARLSDGPTFIVGGEAAAAAEEEEDKREQRRMRVRMKREQRIRELKRDLGVTTPPAEWEGKGGAAVFKSHAHLRGLLNKIRGREP